MDHHDDDNTIWIAIVAAFAAMTGGAAIAWRWVVSTLADYQLLTRDHPVVTLPGAAGYGLDTRRILIGVCVLAVVGLLTSSSVGLARRRAEGRRE